MQKFFKVASVLRIIGHGCLCGRGSPIQKLLFVVEFYVMIYSLPLIDLKIHTTFSMASKLYIKIIYLSMHDIKFAL